VIDCSFGSMVSMLITVYPVMSCSVGSDVLCKLMIVSSLAITGLKSRVIDTFKDLDGSLGVGTTEPLFES